MPTGTTTPTGTTPIEKRRGPSAHPYYSGRETRTVGVFVAAMAVALAALLLKVWPSTQIVDGNMIWINLTEATALSIVMIAGALGAFIHVATSFTSYAGNRTLASSWVWWFIMRPPIGAALALIAYFILRSDLLLSGNLGTDVSPYGIAGLAGVVGLMSKQIVDKLRNVSNAAFDTEQDEHRTDKL